MESTSQRYILTWRYPPEGGRLYRMDDSGFVTCAESLDADNWRPMQRHARADCHAFVEALAYQLFRIVRSEGGDA